MGHRCGIPGCGRCRVPPVELVRCACGRWYDGTAWRCDGCRRKPVAVVQGIGQPPSKRFGEGSNPSGDM